MPSSSDGLPLVSYARMVRRRWVMVLIIVLAMAAPAVGVSFLETPQFVSSAQILLTRQQLDEDFNITPSVLTDTQINNEVAILTSQEVAQRAIKLGAVGPVLAVGKVGSNVVTLSAAAPDAQKSADTVSAGIQAYSDYRKDVVRQALDGTAAQLQANVTELQARIDELDRTAERGSERAVADRATLQQQQATVQARLSRVEIQQQLISPGMTVVQPPQVPTVPISPTPIRNGLFGLVLGLILGISLAVLIESLRQRSRPAPPTFEGGSPYDDTNTAPVEVLTGANGAGGLRRKRRNGVDSGPDQA